MSWIHAAIVLCSLVPGQAAAEPAVLYVPTDPVTLRPTGTPPCGSAVNSALGCGSAAAEMEVPPFAGATDLTSALSANLADYDVHVTNVRPPAYVPYFMLMPDDQPLDVAADGYRSFTCVFGGANCGALQRNRIYAVSGTTENCIDPEIVHAAMYAFGTASGLEGISNPDDWMHYVVDAGPAGGPDYTTPPLGFQDTCNDRSEPQGFNDEGMQVSLPLSCAARDHFACPDGLNGEPGQNSHQDLLMFYGERVEDVDPPELTNLLPEDGTVLAEGDDLVLDVDVADADPIVAGRWTITSDALAGMGINSGSLSRCTNGVVCDDNWPEGPLKPTDSDWSYTVGGLPPGDYVITFEASDFHGNVASTVTIQVTVEGAGGSGSTGGGDGTGSGGGGGGSTGGGGASTGGGGGTGGSDSGDGGAADGGDDGGCSCRTTLDREPAAWLLLFGLAGLGFARRRPRWRQGVESARSRPAK